MIATTAATTDPRRRGRGAGAHLPVASSGRPRAVPSARTRWPAPAFRSARADAGADLPFAAAFQPFAVPPPAQAPDGAAGGTVPGDAAGG
ncbi:MAG TPA: hypothetical protein VGC06_10425, partial [Actinomycetes bacterium]